MQEEFPTSKLLNDAVAEQIFAEGIMLGDVGAAQKNFAELLAKYPTGNAVDNAYSWMEIILRCDGRREEAAKINKEIITRVSADPARQICTRADCRSESPGDAQMPGVDRSRAIPITLEYRRYAAASFSRHELSGDAKTYYIGFLADALPIPAR